MGVIKGDTRSLDNGSFKGSGFRFASKCQNLRCFRV